ncbi:MAG: hypothetical protein AABN95_01170 [Acidobacteriota bacterium]
MNNLGTAVKDFVNAALDLLPQDCEKQTALQRIFIALLVNAHWEAQTYRQDQFADLYDFCDVFIVQSGIMMKTHAQLLRKLKPVLDACKTIKEVLCKTPQCDKDDGSAIIKSCTVGTKYQYAHGISIYFPWNKIEEHYFPGDKYEVPEVKPDYFAVKTGWAKFLERYIECSQRPQRYWPKLNIAESVRELIEILSKDPPEGKGAPGLDPQAAKNPPREWGVNPCVIEPLR